MIFFDVIVAKDSVGGIGRNQQLVWSLKSDMMFFKELTSTQTPLKVFTKFDFQWKEKYLGNTKGKIKQNAVIMGRNTWESLPAFVKPLPRRFNIVLSRKVSVVKKVKMAKDLEEALSQSKNYSFRYIIGGSKVYQKALQHSFCRYIFVTELKDSFDCDTFFPSIERGYKLVSSSPWNIENEIEYRFTCYRSLLNY